MWWDLGLLIPTKKFEDGPNAKRLVDLHSLEDLYKAHFVDLDFLAEFTQINSRTALRII